MAEDLGPGELGSEDDATQMREIHLTELERESAKVLAIRLLLTGMSNASERVSECEEVREGSQSRVIFRRTHRDSRGRAPSDGRSQGSQSNGGRANDRCSCYDEPSVGAQIW